MNKPTYSDITMVVLFTKAKRKCKCFQRGRTDHLLKSDNGTWKNIYSSNIYINKMIHKIIIIKNYIYVYCIAHQLKRTV